MMERKGIIKINSNYDNPCENSLSEWSIGLPHQGLMP